jgi:nitroreductase
MDEKPAQFPKTQPNGAPLKPITEILLERRATNHFTSEPVSDEHLDAILRFGAQAPSGYNFQPWRFIVVRDAANRKRLMAAAYGQEKIAEAPVVLIALGMKEEYKRRAEEVLADGARRGAGKVENVPKTLKGAFDFLGTLPANMWVNRHVMIAFTTLMLVAEAYGFDTAPMEGFDAAAVKREFVVPDEAEVVALLAIGRRAGLDKPYTGRLPLREIYFSERFGAPWASGEASH